MKQNKEIPAGYKDSPLGIIPEEWEVKKLDELGVFLKGKGLPKDKIKSFGNPCLTYGDIYTKYNFVVKNIKSFIDDSTALESQKIEFGDILFAGSGETIEDIGKCVAYIEKEIAYAGGDIIILKPYETDSITLSYILNSSVSNKQKYKFGQGHSIVHIYPFHLKKIEIALPTLPEQKKIAEILCLWDNAIEKQEQLVEKLERRKSVIIQQLLSGRKRLSGYSSPFQVVKLGDIGEFRKGFGVPKNKIINCGQKAITYGEIYTKHDVIIKCFTSFIDVKTASQSQLIEKGDILFAGSGETLEDIGKCVAYIDNDYAFAGGDIIIYKPKSVNSTVLSYILNSPCVIKQKRQMGQGHSIVHIYAKSLSKIKVTLPSIEEQNSIAEVLTNIDKEIDIVKERLAAIRTQKNGLMHRLLTGKTRRII